MMTSVGHLSTLCFALLLTFCIADHEVSQKRESRQSASPRIESDNGIIGIESVAGIASRNGRVSSLGGIRLIPASETGQNFFYPLMNPKLQYGEQDRPTFFPRVANVFPLPENFPATPDYRRQEADTYGAHAYAEVRPEFAEMARNPWLQKEVFERIAQSNVRASEALRNPWFYPNFNPFMYFW